MLVVPTALVDGTIAREGNAGRRWIETLPQLAERMIERWACTPDGTPTHGQVALIVPVASPHGPAVIKLSFPHSGNVDEPKALKLWDGDGAVRLFAQDAENYAMLIERVEQRPLDLGVDEGITIGAKLSARMAVPAPSSMPTLASSAEAWAEQLRGQYSAAGQPFPKHVLDAALETISTVGQDHNSTMIHGDLHAGNILHSARGWVAVDPKGQAGPVEFDAMTMCLHRHEQMLAAADPAKEFARRIDLFCDVAGADRSWARHCVQARLTSSALYDMLQRDSPLQQEWGRLAALVAQKFAG